MKNFKRGCLAALIFFIAVLTLLEVDRRCGFAYREGGNVSAALQVFVEKSLDIN